MLLGFLALSLGFCFTVYLDSLRRLISALQDVCTSIAYWAVNTYGMLLHIFFGVELPEVNVTFMSFPQQSFEEIFNIDFLGLAFRLRRFFEALPTSYDAYKFFLSENLYYFSLFSSLFIPLFFLVPVLVVLLIFSENGKPTGYISKPARLYFRFLERVFKPMGKYISSFVDYCQEHKKTSYVIITVWLVNFNVVSICAELVAFYFYGRASMDSKAILYIVGYIVMDLLLLFVSAPLLYWLSVVGYSYYHICKYFGLERLKAMEAMNCGFLKTLDIIVLISGEPGTGKTTLLVDMFLSWINIFKDESLKSMYKFEMYFPTFPWARYREDLLSRFGAELKVLPDVEDYVDRLEATFNSTSDDEILYGYNTAIYKTTVNVGSREISLFETLKEYGKAFKQYSNENLGIVNFSIRMDGNFDESKYFKKWNGNFFERKKISRYAHILNQDMLRHGVKKDPTSKEIGAFGPSVIGWAEISKDLGNQNSNAQYKADSLTCNAKNEKSIHAFMFARHAKALIDNNPQIRIITDDQRVSNVSAAAVGLMCTINIQGKSETKIALPGFDWYLDFEAWFSKHSKKWNEKRENVRGDVTLSWLLIKQLFSLVKMPAERIRNQFGYEELQLLRQAGNAFGSTDGARNAAGAPTEHVYYKMYWKVYNDRFISDSHSSAYAQAQQRSGISIDDIPTYQSLRMTPDEIRYQRSRLGDELLDMLSGQGYPSNEKKVNTHFEHFDEF